MSGTRTPTGLVVLLLVALDVAEADERFAEDGHPAFAMFTGSWGKRGRRGSDVRVGRELEVVASRRCASVCDATVGGGSGLVGGNAELSEDRVGVVEGEDAANAHDQLDPELLLVGEKLTEALEEFAILDRPMSTSLLLRLLWGLPLGVVLLPGSAVDGAVEDGDALLIHGYDGIRCLHP